MKQVNPYTRLLAEIRKYLESIKYRHRTGMFRYSMEYLEQQTAWTLNDLYERTIAAEQLGYDVQLRADKNGLHVEYVKQIPLAPYRWR